MKLNILGIPLTSQKIQCGNVAIGISPYVYTYVEQMIKFAKGGPLPVNEGDVARGSISGETAIVVSLKSKGSWDDGTATGTLRIKSASGMFLPNEPLSIGALKESITMVGVPTDCRDEYENKGKNAVRALVTLNPKDSTRERAWLLVSFDGSSPDHNSLLGHARKDGDDIFLNSIDEIRKIRFLEYIAGSKVVVVVSCFF